jgi:hypothetical protein
VVDGGRVLDEALCRFGADSGDLCVDAHGPGVAVEAQRAQWRDVDDRAAGQGRAEGERHVGRADVGLRVAAVEHPQPAGQEPDGDDGADPRGEAYAPHGRDAEYFGLQSGQHVDTYARFRRSPRTMSK